MKKSLTVYLPFFILFVLLAQNAYAQGTEQTQEPQQQTQETQQQKFGGYLVSIPNQNAIKPNEIIAELKPGETYQDIITVENQNDIAQNFSAYGSDEKTGKDNKTAYKFKSDTQENIGLWLTFNEPEFLLQPKEKKGLPFKIIIPVGTKLGEYKGAISIQQESVKAGVLNYSARTALKVDIKVTDNPQPVPKMDHSIFGYIKFYLAKASWFFWTTVIIFLGCLWYFIRARRKEKHAHHHKKNINAKEE
jgi:hypothetical protein